MKRLCLPLYLAALALARQGQEGPNVVIMLADNVG
jgi:hypothetical protein